MAGLACAVRLARAGAPVVLYEQSRRAGGRCRSYFDRRLEQWLDTGIHLALTRHNHLLDFLHEIGASDQLVGPGTSHCRFVDVLERRDWTLRPNSGPIPWWILAPGRSPPNSGFGDLVALARLAHADPDTTVSACIPTNGGRYRQLWEPITIAGLNTPPALASARLMWWFIRDGLWYGADYYRQRFTRDALASSLVEPALATIRQHGGTVHLLHRAQGLSFEHARATAIAFTRRRIPLDPADIVVVALPPAAAGRLVPGLTVPERSSAILTVHYRLDPPAPPQPELTCVIEQRSLWMLVRNHLATVTVGAADDLLPQMPTDLARRFWPHARAVLGRGDSPVPAFRVMKFRNGTFAHTPTDVMRRPGERTRWRNVFVAGDWTETRLPATVEGAILSGQRAAAAALGG